MKKLVILLLFLFLLTFGCNNDSGDDDFNGHLEITITNISSLPATTVLTGIFDYPTFTETSTDVIGNDVSTTIGSEDSKVITIQNIPVKKVYFAILIKYRDTDTPSNSNSGLFPETSDTYYLYNGVTYGETPTAFTLTNGETTQISVDYTTFKTY